MKPYIKLGKIKFSISRASLPKSRIEVDGHELIKDWDHIEIMYDALDEEGLKIMNDLSGDIEVCSGNGHYIFREARINYATERMAIMSFDSYEPIESDDPWSTYTI